MCSDSKVKNQKKMMVFAAPSGSGKTTIVRHLLDKFEELAFSISATTRPIRDYEIDGHDYYFLSVEEFRKRIETGAFVEWVEVYEGRYYGTLVEEVERLWAKGKYVLFDIDVLGARQIKEKYGDQCLLVFVKPPSVEALIDRLEKRKTETEATLQIRKERFHKELGYEVYFDRVLINDQLHIALEEAEQLTREFLGLVENHKKD
jgi:guanylate kinase